MAANTTPIFAAAPSVSVGTLIGTAANAALDGTGTVATIFTAGANGSRIDYIRIKSTGTCVATVVRFFINNGGATTTAANNSLIAEQAIAAYTLSQTAASTDYIISLGIALPPGYKITCCVGTAVATNFAISAYGADF